MKDKMSETYSTSEEHECIARAGKGQKVEVNPRILLRRRAILNGWTTATRTQLGTAMIIITWGLKIFGKDVQLNACKTWGSQIFLANCYDGVSNFVTVNICVKRKAIN